MIFRYFFAFLLFTGCILQANATHIVGGEMTYKCLGNNQYEITLIVYRDCYTGIPPFDDPASIAVFDSSWNLVQHILVPLDPNSNDTLPIILSDPCLTVPPDVCAHGTTYKTIVQLPKIPGGYSLVYQRCCRNQLIRNIIRPLRTGITIISHITEEALDACNNSATFNQWPPVAICIHQPINFDHAATDIDGDSLVYRLCTPLHGADSLDPIPQPPYAGPYMDVIWRDPPYNLSDMLGGTPLTIDPSTGFMTGIPNLIGNFVVGVCVDEYRDGQLLSVNRRDFQYNVSDCGQPLAAFFVPEVVCDTLTVKFLNQGLQNHSYQWYFNWGADTSWASTQYSPLWTYPDTGYYTIALIAESKPTCRDTLFKTIHVTDSYIDASLNFTFPDCDQTGLIVQAADLSTDSLFNIVSWQWTLTGPGGLGTQSGEQNPSFSVTEPGQYRLKLVATSGNGCTDTQSFLFFPPIPTTDFLADSTVICQGDSVFLFPGADETYTYQWSPGTGLSDTTIANPLAYPDASILYTLLISGNGPCVIEKTVKVTVVQMDALLATAAPDTIFPGETSQLNVSAPGVTQFAWQPAGSLSIANIPNPVASPPATTDYIVTAPLAGSCVLRDTVRVVVRSVFCDEPFVFLPNGFSPNGDGENDELKLESDIVTEVYWVVFNRWGEKIFEADSLEDAWDGTYKGQAQPTETYGYFLRVVCSDGAIFEKKGNLTLLR